MIKPLSIVFFLFLSSFIIGQVTDGLVAKFSFNKGEDYDELSKRKAKLVGVNFSDDRFGNPNNAVFFYGNKNSYINLGNYPALKPRCGTISLWVKMEYEIFSGRGLKIDPILITKCADREDYYEAYAIYYGLESKRIGAGSSRDSIKQFTVYSLEEFSRMKWHHLVFSYDDGSFSFYIDGKLEGTATKDFETKFNPLDSVMLGTTASIKNERSFNGLIDDVTFYNRVLSPGEVKELYNAPDPDRNHVYWLWFYRILALTILVTGIVLLITRRYKLALVKEKEKNRVNMRLIELETKAIRTQMNPHFMFNSLNTLQRFILEEDIRGAHLYLSKFSKLLRKILESSTAESISLAEEIEILNSYVEIEKLRFNDSFDFKISSTVPEPEKYYIPFLLVQPFVENAIWHGLLPLKGLRFLNVDFSNVDERTILCVIEDNGVGRGSGGDHKDPFKKKSLALDFIKQRLELLEKSTGAKCAFKIIDKKNDTGQNIGTRVEITIPKLN